MIARSREDNKLSFPAFSLSGTVLKVCDEVKYLGHYITDDLSDDRDIHRQYCMTYAHTNMLNCKFSMCSLSVKTTLFAPQCILPTCGGAIKKSSMQKLSLHQFM